MTRRVISLIACLVPAAARPRWREEWLAEINEIRKTRGVRVSVRLATGAFADALVVRRLAREQPRTGARNPFRGIREDARDVLRSLRHSPGFACSVIASLGLGIAGMVTAFTFVNGILFRPFPGVRDQHELLKVWLLADARRPGWRLASFDDYLLLREGLTSFSGLAAQTTGSIAVRIDGRAEAIRAAMVSDNYFDVLGVSPQAGRFFSAERGGDDHGVIVISHRTWINQFGGRRDILGRTIELGAIGHAEIIGVAPAGLVGTSRGDVGIPGAAVELWIPIALGRRVFPPPTDAPRGTDPETTREFQFIGRLRPGVSQADAQAESAVVARRFAAARTDRRNAAIQMEPVTFGHPEQRLMAAASVLAVPALVLIIGCVNAANLLLARGMRQSRELAVRVALGATRWRIIRPLLLESVLLSLFAVAASLPVARWALSFAQTFIDLPMPFDRPVLAFAVLLASCTAVVFALIPSLRLSAASPGAALGSGRPGESGPGRMRARRILIAAQVAMSAGLLATGTQLLSFLPAQRPSSGTPPERLLLVTLDTSQLRMTDRESAEFYRRVLEKAAVSPEADGVGLARAAGVWTFGRTRGYSQLRVWRPDDGSGNGTMAEGGYAGGELFRATGQRIISGRAFNAEDLGTRARTLVINRPLAEQLFPGGAVGHLLKVAPGNKRYADAVELTVVGVVEPVHEPTYSRGLPVPAAYFPIPLEPEPKLVVYARARNSTAALASEIRSAVSSVDPRMPPIEVETLARLGEIRLFPERLAASGVSILGLIGLLLATGGVYGVMSYLVSMRAKELGIRIALGAAPSAILTMTLREALRLAGTGAAIGGFGALIVSKLLQSGMYGVKALNLPMFAAVLLILTAAVVVASVIPARRAARVDPIAALRQE